MLSKYTLTAALLLAAASASLAAVAPLSSGALDANRIRGLYRRDGPALDFDAKDETAGKPLPSALLNSGSFILTPDEDTYDGLFQKGEQDDYIAPPPASSAKAPSSSSPSVDPQIQQLFADDGQNEYFGNDSSSSKDPSIPDDLFITPTASPTSEPVSEHGNASPNFEAKDAGDQNVTTDSGGFVSLIPVSHLQATASPTEDSDPVITPTPSTTPQPKEKGNDESNFNPASSNADQDEKGDNITDPHANILIQKPDSPSSTEDSSSIAGPTLTTDDSDNNSSSQNNSSSNLSNLIQRPIQPLVRPPPILPLDQDKETDSTPSSSIVENEKPSRTALLPDLESNPPRVPLLPNLGSKPSSDEEESSTPSNTEKDGKSSRTPLTDNLVVNPLFDEQTNGDQPTSPPLLPNLVPKLSSDDEESSTPSSTENDEKPSRTPLPSSDEKESSTPSNTENDEKPSRTPLVNKLVAKPSLNEQNNEDQPSQNDESDPSLPSTPSRTTPNYLKPSSVQGGNNAVVADTNPISDLNEEGKSGKVEKDDLSPSSPNSSASSQEPAATSFTGSDLPKLSL
ncbi:MAG: hypothetical protein DHS80DRAFT_26052 [Piptocephalis tieghemiana]|nr:MAG: hypothetical protein DHS80DRAFT_26052 [Piptocephalis tieghemiana]